MAFLGKDYVVLLKHILATFVVGLLIMAVAIAFAKIEMWCEHEKLPKYVIFGVRTISVASLIVDGILVIGTMAVAALKLLRGMWRHGE